MSDVDVICNNHLMHYCSYFAFLLEIAYCWQFSCVARASVRAIRAFLSSEVVVDSLFVFVFFFNLLSPTAATC